MTSSSSGRTGAFISYSHQDNKYLGEFRRHLDYLEREGKVHVWDDTKIKPGANWREEIKEAIQSAKVAILLVSADFLASKFIATNELPPLLAAARQEGATILPVIVKPSLFKRSNLEQFQAVNDPSKPLSGMTAAKRDEMWARVAELVFDALEAQKPVEIVSDTSQTKTEAMSQALSEPTPSAKGLSHEEYIESLLGSDPVLGNLAVEFFAMQGAKSLDELIPILDKPPSVPQARYRLARLFGRFGETAVGPLLKAIEDSDWHSQVLAAECFRDIPARVAGDRVAQLLSNNSIHVVRCAIDALGYMGADDWDFKIRELATKSEYWNEKLRSNSLEALTRFIAKETRYDFVNYDFNHLENFIARCAEYKVNINEDSQLYHQVASVFREFKPIVIDKVVQGWAAHDRPLFRAFAADIFGWLKAQRTLKWLVGWLLNDAEDYGVRCLAAISLGQFGTPEARSILLQALRSLDLSITGKSRIALTLHGSLLFALSLLLYQVDNKDNLNDLNDVIDELLHSTFSETRAQTFYALGVLTYRPDDIRAGLDADDYLVRGAAALAYARINGSHALRRLQSLERDVANPIEQLLVLCSLIRAGQIEMSEELYRSLCNYPLAYQLRYVWQREILWSLTRGTAGLDRAEAWADLMDVDLQRCLGEIDWIDALITS